MPLLGRRLRRWSKTREKASVQAPTARAAAGVKTTRSLVYHSLFSRELTARHSSEHESSKQSPPPPPTRATCAAAAVLRQRPFGTSAALDRRRVVESHTSGAGQGHLPASPTFTAVRKAVAPQLPLLVRLLGASWRTRAGIGCDGCDVSVNLNASIALGQRPTPSTLIIL